MNRLDQLFADFVRERIIKSPARILELRDKLAAPCNTN